MPRQNKAGFHIFQNVAAFEVVTNARDGRASVLERCSVDPVKKEALVDLICQVLVFVGVPRRVRLNEVLRTLNKEQLQQRLQVDALLSLAVLRLPMVCKEVYEFDAHDRNVHVVLSYGLTTVVSHATARRSLEAPVVWLRKALLVPPLVVCI